MTKCHSYCPDQVRFTWNIHYTCNYRCAYCYFDEHWDEYGKRNVYLGVEEWVRHWRRIYDKHGQCFLIINGGEPFAYPNFIELIGRLQEIHWPINITSNTSMHLDKFVRTADPSKVSLSVSFHPQYHNVDDFLGKIFFLRQHGFTDGCVNFVGWPPFLKDLPHFLEKFNAVGESLKVIPFVGPYNGVQYPEGYTAEQRRALGISDGWVDSKRRKGTLCRAGHRSGMVLPSTDVARCGQLGERYVIGNIQNEEFSLMPEPELCNVEFCPCDEWKIIPDEKAPEKPGILVP
jgi:MoaA/NifB/PqqE/SkfB family radical SAM enzyme